VSRARFFFVVVLSGAIASPAVAQSRDSTAVIAPPRDSFLGIDKPKHFLLSFFVESVSFAAMQAAGANRTPAMTGSTIVTASVAIGREFHDRRTKGLFSFGDLLWDALGAGTAIVMLRHTYR
jgi:uncharacterized protein YfiM (DUF2279 family)